MTVAILRFGGSNCDRDTKAALDHLGIDAEIVWFEDRLPPETTGVVLPGGFSYGDYLRPGAMAARTDVIDDVRAAIGEEVPVLGVCNGAQIGCEAGLVPGAFTVNDRARFRCEHVHVRVENADTRWTSAYDEGDVLELPIAHGEGRYEVAPEVFDELNDEDRIILRYCDADGAVTPESNPNGSKGNVAGVVDDRETVAVLMPHPERASLPDVNGADGHGILRGLEA